MYRCILLTGNSVSSNVLNIQNLCCISKNTFSILKVTQWNKMYYKVFSYYPCDFHTQLWKCLATTVLKIRLQLQKSFQPIVCELNWIAIHSRKHSGAGIWGPGGPLALPIFSRSVNPIPTGGGQEGRLCPPITTGTPKFFHLPASLKQCNVLYYCDVSLLGYDWV